VKVVSLLLQDPEIKVEDRLIIESAMSLWSALLSNSKSEVPMAIDP
jgi:mRNA-degrading endonuclease YafQ of YafQ-DinJ toxin-antitoxin module